MTRTRRWLPLSLGLLVACGGDSTTAPDASDPGLAAADETSVLVADIDVQPFGNPAVNVEMGGYITVAVFDSEALPIDQIDAASVTFEGAKPVHDLDLASVLDHHVQTIYLDDVPYDVFLFHFAPDQTALVQYATGTWVCAELTGTLVDGTPFAGCDDVRVERSRGHG